MRSMRSVHLLGAGAFGEHQKEFIERAAGHHRAGKAPGTRSDFDLAGVMSVLDAAIGVTVAQSPFARPRIVRETPIPCYHGSNNDVQGGLLSTIAQSAPSIGGLRGGRLHPGASRTVGNGCSRPRQRREAFGNQNGHIKHAQADRYCEQPGIQLAGDPIQADQVMLHPATSCSSLGCGQHRPVMLRRNIKTRKRLLKYD